MKTLSVTTKENLKLFDKLNQMSFKFNNISQNIQNISNGLQDAIQPGIALNSSLADLSAIAGVTGDKLKEIEGCARKTAKAFGVDAAQSVESYKLILSQLSPELGKHPEALRAMGDNIATLSKTMGGDATAAAEEMFEKISEYGKATVYDKSGLIEAQKTMMSFGIEGEKAFSTLKQIGDIAMGDSQKMQSLALAFSQAFAWATEEGGLFYQGAEKAGDSTMGKINQLKDTVDEFLINVFDRLKPVIDICLSFATGFLDTLPALFDGIANGVSNVIGFFSEFAPIIIGVATAMGILTIAMNASKISMAAQELILNALIIKEKIVIGLTNLWAGAQAILNAVMALNPITLIVAAIAVLVGAIVLVCSKITGWGSLWKGIVGFMKYTFLAFVDTIKLYFTTYINGFLIGLDEIRLGWYKFKEAVGMGDSEESQNAINAINESIEARKKAISDGAQSVQDNLIKAKESLDGIDMGWKKKEDVSEFLNDPRTFGINHIAIESYDFPFTKGLENQSFTIKAYSDDSYKVLEEA